MTHGVVFRLCIIGLVASGLALALHASAATYTADDTQIHIECVTDTPMTYNDVVAVWARIQAANAITKLDVIKFLHVADHEPEAHKYTLRLALASGELLEQKFAIPADPTNKTITFQMLQTQQWSRGFFLDTLTPLITLLLEMAKAYHVQQITVTVYK